MNLVWMLSTICVLCGCLGLWKAIKNRRDAKDVDHQDDRKPQGRAFKTSLRVAVFTTIVVSAHGLLGQAFPLERESERHLASGDFVKPTLQDSVSNANSSNLSSNSTQDSAKVALPGEHFVPDRDLQTPPRRRYSRPTYSDSHQNADGSNKYTFLAGGGVTLPTGNTKTDLKTNFDVQAGVGRNFNKNFGVIAQFDYANFGIQTNTLDALLATYNSIGAIDQNGNPLTQLGGNSHVWSLTLNPIYTVMQRDKLGAYVVGGFGFYHKTANFTIPGVGTYCDPYYGCYQYQANQSIDKYTSNAIGFNGGAGLTYKLSNFASARLYVEARYVFVNNQARPYSTGSATSSYFNVFPQNSQHTTYIPITVGIRF